MLSIFNKILYLCTKKIYTMSLISRPKYYKRIESVLGKGVLVVLTGQRRVGKSYVMKELVQRKSEESNANVIYIDKERTEFDNITSYIDLVQYIDNHRIKDKHNYIFIDEIQEISEFERALRNYYNDDDIDIVITGSNSHILSGDLATMLSGRYIEVFIQGLSYSEFIQFHQLEDNDSSLMKYINYGGLPGLTPFGLNDSETIRSYMQGVYNTILVKDIISRNAIRNVQFLENLIRYIGDNIGKPLSATNIHNFVVTNQNDVSKNIILKYLKSIAEAFLVHDVSRYNIHGKKLLETNNKYYFGDVGIRNFVVGGRRANDIEKILENIVYQHLVRMSYVVNVGQLNNTEIDFVAAKGDDVKYIQVSYIIANDDTFAREFGNLMQIKDNFPKYVISMTPLMDVSVYEGIVHIPFREFLKLESFSDLPK